MDPVFAFRILNTDSPRLCSFSHRNRSSYYLPCGVSLTGASAAAPLERHSSLIVHSYKEVAAHFLDGLA